LHASFKAKTKVGKNRQKKKEGKGGGEPETPKIPDNQEKGIGKKGGVAAKKKPMWRRARNYRFPSSARHDRVTILRGGQVWCTKNKKKVVEGGQKNRKTEKGNTILD